MSTSSGIWRVSLIAAVGVFAAVVGVSTLITWHRMGHWLLLSGPNTVGEAGKVYFADRFASGQSLFVSADQPPYYASMHGALLHASVGMIGRVLDLGPRGLYYAGRAISVLGTLVALVAAWGILRELGVRRWPWMAAVVAVWFATEPIVSHAVSYRPDHWVLAFSVGACWLVIRHGQRRWAPWVLALTPAVAFFIKAPGLALVIPIAWGLSLHGRKRAAAATATRALLLWAGGLALLELTSDGRFSEGLQSGLAMPVSWRYAWSMLAQSPAQWLAWVAPWLLLRWFGPVRDPAWRPWWIASGFFATAFIVSTLAATRAGSNVYYWVDSFLYGTLLVVARLAYEFRDGRIGPTSAMAAVQAALVAPWAWQVVPASVPINPNTPMDTAVRATLQFDPYRHAFADRINREKLLCYSDDPGLNVLLDRPQVIYPFLPALMVANGSMSTEDLIEPVRQRRYDVIVLTRMVQQQMGTPNLPAELVEAIGEHYLPAESDSPYLVLQPRPRGGAAP